MLPSHGDEILGKFAAVWTIVYSSFFGTASLAQALGIIVPVAFLVYKWKNESLRRQVLEKILTEPDPARRSEMVDMLKVSNSKPGDL